MFSSQLHVTPGNLDPQLSQLLIVLRATICFGKELQQPSIMAGPDPEHACDCLWVVV